MDKGYYEKLADDHNYVISEINIPNCPHSYILYDNYATKDSDSFVLVGNDREQLAKDCLEHHEIDTQIITVTLSGGMIQHVKFENVEGVVVITKDYDVSDFDIENSDHKRDTNGDEYYEGVWRP